MTSIRYKINKSVTPHTFFKTVHLFSKDFSMRFKFLQIVYLYFHPFKQHVDKLTGHSIVLLGPTDGHLAFNGHRGQNSQYKKSREIRGANNVNNHYLLRC